MSLTGMTETSGSALCFAASRRPRRANACEPLQIVAVFDDDEEGASALTEAVRAATRRWGIWWVEARAARLAHAQAMWLLGNDHPAETHLRVRAEYDSDSRMFTITVGDPGGLLPTLIVGDQWRLSLSGAVSADAFHHGGKDRRLRCALKVRAPWRVRITWDRARLEGTHPEYTFEDCGSEADARAAVGGARRREAVRAAHWQGPDERDEVWREAGEVSSGDV